MRQTGGDMLVKQALTFRQCEAVDLPFIIQLSAEALAEYAHRPVSQTLALVSRHRTWIALRGTRRVGFVAIGAHDGVAVLHALAVVPSERGNGVGYRLMQLFERSALQNGSRRLELCTAACNLAALDLFFRRGFRLLTRKARFYALGQDACVLVKDLKAREQRARDRDAD
jgi:ribosomal protein S18 acetylase RimI-like enzyme